MGIDVVDDDSSYHGTDPNCPRSGGSMHDKFFVVDRSIVWMGSTNMTFTGLNYNHNHAVRLRAASVAASFEQEFERMFAGTFARDKAGGGLSVHDVAGIEVTTAFSPYGHASTPETEALVVAAIETARESIEFAMFYLTAERVRTALVRQAGITQGILDATGASYFGSQHQALCAAGVDVKVENFPGKLHDKLGVFDPLAAGAQVILGSANWTSSGFAYNDESLLLVSDAALARTASAEYAALYHHPANQGLQCCDHSPEGFNENSPSCGSVACVCSDALDNDYDFAVDEEDADCAAAFQCP